ncbi:hypothetical protein BAC7755_46820 [Bacillus sp. MN7755]
MSGTPGWTTKTSITIAPIIPKSMLMIIILLWNIVTKSISYLNTTFGYKCKITVGILEVKLSNTRISK